MMYSRRGTDDSLKHMGEGHVPVKGCHYGSLIAEPLTKEQLLSALATIQMADANMDYLLDLDGYDFPDGQESEAAKKCAEALYSDEFLKRLNGEMMPVYVADADTDDGSISALAMSTEGFVGHGIEMLPKVWPKPAVRVGSVFDGGGGCGPYVNYCEFCTYIDIDGGVFVVRCFNISTHDDDPVTIIEGRELVQDCDEFSLDMVEDLFPAEFHGFWDR